MLGQLCTRRVRRVKAVLRFGAQGAATPGGFGSLWVPWGSVKIRIAREQAAPTPRPHRRCPGLPGTNLLLPTVTRGDVFALPEDDYLDYNLTVDFGPAEGTEAPPTELPTAQLPAEPTVDTKPGPEDTLPEVPVEEVPSTTPDGVGEREPVDEPEELCSRKPFDAFTDLKNGSLYAFRGSSETSPRHGTRCWAVTPCWRLWSLLLLPPSLSPQGSTSTSWTRRACGPATPSSSATSGASRAPSTQPSHASTARARLTCSRWAGTWLQGWGCSRGGWYGPPTHPVPLHTCTHTVAARYPQIPVAV